MQLIKLPAIALLFVSFTAAAEVQLTKAEILGIWQIDKESNTSDGSKARSSNTTWTFKEDGTIEGMTHENDSHARIDQMRAVLNYSVEGGKIVKQAAPGRSKMETCEALEKTGSTMVLKCQTVYFFMSKK
ncbi:lipocalin family protein [Methylomonas sp. 2BW1-5-20]|uniref:lipocalin family protein n=1 Tax=Methylomonas sp. 2BW1-5-20 TaxID=3376686 RepID=UPI00404CA200